MLTSSFSLMPNWSLETSSSYFENRRNLPENATKDVNCKGAGSERRKQTNEQIANASMVERSNLSD